jgi:hypothetical protein
MSNAGKCGEELFELWSKKRKNLKIPKKYKSTPAVANLPPVIPRRKQGRRSSFVPPPMSQIEIEPNSISAIAVSKSNSSSRQHGSSSSSLTKVATKTSAAKRRGQKMLHQFKKH